MSLLSVRAFCCSHSHVLSSLRLGPELIGQKEASKTFAQLFSEKRLGLSEDDDHDPDYRPHFSFFFSFNFTW